jgi:hypothetical protein
MEDKLQALIDMNNSLLSIFHSQGSQTTGPIPARLAVHKEAAAENWLGHHLRIQYSQGGPRI